MQEYSRWLAREYPPELRREPGLIESTVHGAWWVRLNVILSNVQHLFWLAVFSRWHGIYCHSIDPQSTFHWHSIYTSVETPLTSQSTVGRYLTNFLLMRVGRSTLNHASTNCWSNVDWCRASIELDVDHVSIEMLIEGINWEYWSTIDQGCL